MFWIFTVENVNITPKNNDIKCKDIIVYYVIKQGITKIVEVIKVNPLTYCIKKHFIIPIKIQDLKIDIHYKKFIKLYIAKNKLCKIDSYGKNIMAFYDSQEEDLPKKVKAFKSSEESDSESKSVSSSKSLQSESEDSSESESSESEVFSTNDLNGSIPILLDPCEDLCYHIDAKTCVFHYLKCPECKITNNNNSDISHIIKDIRADFYKINNLDPKINDIITAYQSVNVYNNIKSSVEMYHIAVKQNTYKNCIFIIVCL